MKRIAALILAFCLLFALVACGDKEQPTGQGTTGQTDGPGMTIATEAPGKTDNTQTQGQNAAPQPEVYSVIAYAVGEVSYEGDELKTYGIEPTELTLNADHTGKLNLMGTEMDIGWTDDGDITIAGQKFYSFYRADAETLVMKIMESEFTMHRTSAPANTQPVSVEATQKPADQTEQEPTQKPAVQTAETSYVEPYGDSDGVIDHDKLLALYHWLNSMQSEFRYALSFDEIGAAAGKAGCDKKDSDGKYHNAYWTDGDKGFVTVTFREKDGRWTCGSISTALSSSDYNAADISAFPKLGSGAPAGSSPVEHVDLEQKCSGKTIVVGAEVPTKGWFAFKGSFDIRICSAPFEKNAKDSYSYIKIEFEESENKINSDADGYDNLTALPARTVGGIQMTGRSYQKYGMDWTEYYGQVADGVWVSIKLTGVDLSAGTETEALLDSLTFTVQ